MTSISYGPLLGLWGPSVPVPSGLGWWSLMDLPQSSPHPWWSGFGTLTPMALVQFPAEKGGSAATADPNLFLGGCTALECFLGFSAGAPTRVHGAG